jgi:hypothetical protein
MRRGWSPFSASQLPLVFARDRSGKLVAYSLENTVRFRCHDASIYAMTDGLEAYVGQQMRVARFDQQGIANVTIAAKVTTPRGEWSQIDPDSLRFTDTAVTFTRWYWNTDTHAVTRRQQIELDLQDPTRRVKPFPAEPPTNST